MTLHVVTAKVNGIRAALRRGGLTWLADSGADVLCLQEVRATPEQVDEALGAAGLGEWHLALAPGARNGHAGVALLARAPLTDVVLGVGGSEFADQGRWVEASVSDPDGRSDGRSRVRVASVYVHTGEPEGPGAQEKDRFLAEMGAWMAAHSAEAALVCGDLNVAHSELDIKNWRGNRGRLGSSSPSVRTWIGGTQTHPTAPDGSTWAAASAREGPGPYTWWSWRGRGFDTDGGWRIDAVLASPEMAARATGVTVHKAASYAERWSDHAAVSATFT